MRIWKKMEIVITLDETKKIFPEDLSWYNDLNETLPLFGITTKQQIAHFMAQCAHESGNFTITQENLNYSADGLMKVFSKYFPNLNKAKQYARRPEAIANLVYANRMGNGSEASGDGWKFRGRGYIQVTGKNNYFDCSKALFNNDQLLVNPDILKEREYALSSACWFWRKNKLNDKANMDDILGITKTINGGTNGLDERKKYYAKFKTIFNL